MTPPLDLRAVEETANAFTVRLEGSDRQHERDRQIQTDLTALLAHCRALRAALKQAERWANRPRPTYVRCDVCGGGNCCHYDGCWVPNATAVLAQATDQEGARRE